MDLVFTILGILLHAPGLFVFLEKHPAIAAAGGRGGNDEEESNGEEFSYGLAEIVDKIRVNHKVRQEVAGGLPLVFLSWAAETPAGLGTCGRESEQCEAALLSHEAAIGRLLYCRSCWRRFFVRTREREREV